MCIFSNIILILYFAQKNISQEKNMKKSTKILLSVIIGVLVIALGIGAAMLIRLKKLEETGIKVIDIRKPEVSDDSNFINVAIYPYVPNLPDMEKKCEAMFKKINPDVTLNFVDWDCYASTDPENIDVFMYDAIYLDCLYEKGYLSELNLSDYSDMDLVMPFALEDTAITVDGESKTFGIPNLLCSTFLFYRKDDAELADASNIFEIYDAIGKAPAGRMLHKGKGLLMNYLDEYPYYYIEAMRDDMGPDGDPASIEGRVDDPEALRSLNAIAKMGGKSMVEELALVYRFSSGYNKAEKFSEGYGRAFIGFSENYSFMGDNKDNIDVKMFSFSDKENVATFYTDLVSINSSVTDEKKRENCKQLVNLLTCREYVESIGTIEDKAAYLLPAREVSYGVYAEKYPLYTRLLEQISAADKHVERYGSWSEEYIWGLYETLPPMVHWQ